MSIFEALKEWLKPSPSAKYIKVLRKAGIKKFPRSEELVAFGNKILLVYPDVEYETARNLMKLWGYKGRLTVPFKNEQLMYFCFIQDCLHSEYRKRDVLRFVRSATRVTLAAKVSEVTLELNEFMQEAGVKIVNLLFDRGKITLA